MVPYVRKSFAKHWKEGVYYLEYKNNFLSPMEEDNIALSLNDDTSSQSIEWPNYKSYIAAYEYAMEMTEKELKQAVEGMFHNLNTLQSRSGNQLPFTSINFGTCTLPEGRMVIKALLEGNIKGVGKHHKTCIFPCSIFQCMKGVNRAPGDPNYDLFQLALKSTAQRLYPNYANADVSMQKNWVQYDRENKEKIINSLSDQEKEKLILRLEENPELQKFLSLSIVEE